MSIVFDIKEETRTLGQNINLRFTRLSESHTAMLLDFSCGNGVLDAFIQSQAMQSVREKTYLMIDEDERRIVAFASLSCSAIPVMSNDIYNDFIPAVEITYFALDVHYQKLRMSEDPEDRYLSDHVLNQVIQQIYDFTDNICGAMYVILHSTPDGYHLYRRNAFQDMAEPYFLKRQSNFLEGCTPMYLRLED